ncbi:MAG: DNA repair protein RecN [Elusimicrobiota bacterium]|nr:DNA repair protein RecN [Elusimicrobiota bacterium]
MLRRLKVLNFAVAEKVELELGPGFTALTGETGAGKSILLEALGFLLGGRGSSSWLRAGAQRLEVEGLVDAADVPADLRRELGLDGKAVELRRELDATGRTRAMIAGRPAPVAALGRVGDHFADFHGQHESRTLLQAASQLELLDRFGGLDAERVTLAEAYAAWSGLRVRLEASSLSEAERERRADLLRFQVEEIDGARLRMGEDEALEESLPRLKNAERLRGLADTAYGLLYAEENAAVARLLKASRAVSELAKLDPAAGSLHTELEGAHVAAGSVARELGNYRDAVSADPAALDALLARQDVLARLKKRHGVTLSAVLETRERLAVELDGLINADAHLEKTRKELAKAEAELARLSGEAHDKRVKAARKLDAAALKELKVLGLPHARFSCAVEMEEGSWSKTGADAVEFLLAPNPGEPPRPVKSAASGGELSRVMLALKTVFAKADRTALLVFDEVDAGIGGEVAHAVGERLSALAKGRQVLCITHLPQVACFAQNHFHAVKDVAAGRTRLRVDRLGGAERLETVATMLGGKPTGASRKHAQELLESSI